MITRVDVRRGEYHDSVRLMQASRTVAAVPDVEEALVAMATPLNLQLLAGLGFEPPPGAGPDDLLVAVRAAGDDAIAAAAEALAAALAPAASPAGGMLAPPPPRTVASAARAIGANLALLSVPGRHAFVEAMEALRAGLHVMVFSDNVAVEHEVALKAEAARRGLLMMGPDCGTAIVGGVGLGFANVVRPGPVGIVGASGTGIQQLCCLLDDAGLGVRHALGTGSRDLSAAVGGATTLAALEALDADPGIEVIVLVSKPPDPEVAARVRAAAAGTATPVVTALGGETTLEDAAAEVQRRLGRQPAAPASWPAAARPARPGRLAGLFSGGTLCAEARMMAAGLGQISAGPEAAGHVLCDLGADEYTRGRAHPMIDLRLRRRHLARLAADPTMSVLLVDVVLGHGAHPDPAGEMAPELAAAVAGGAAVVASLCGSAGDPQQRGGQTEALQRAGASVFLSNAAAARHAVALVEEAAP